MRIRRASGLAIAAIWTIVALADVTDSYITRRLNGQPSSFWWSALRFAPGWLLWAVLTPAIFRLGRRFPLTRRPSVMVIALHLGASVIAGCIHAAIVTAAAAASAHRGFEAVGFWGALADWFPVSIVLYWSVLVAGHAVDTFRQYREQEMRSAALAAELSRAQLAALRAQLHPHFLFNALNAAVGLVRAGQPEAGVDVLTHLGELLRHLLQDEASHEIPLRDEMLLLDRYLAVERARFGDRLTTIVAPCDGLADALVPSLVLQPLVENAVRHGVARREAPVAVRVEMFAVDQVLHLRVTDDGPGLPLGWSLERGAGVGLRNTRARIAALYGDAARLELRAGRAEGTEAEIMLPLRYTCGESR